MLCENWACLPTKNECGSLIGKYGIGCGNCCVGIRGNIDYDSMEQIDIGDLIHLVLYSFGSPSGPAPPCFEEADTNADGSIDISDIIYLVDYMFRDGPLPLPCD